MKSARNDGRPLTAYSRTRSSDLRLLRVMLASGAGLVLFAAVATSVIHLDPMTAWDIRTLQWLHSGRTPFGIEVFTILSFFGSPLFLACLGAVMAVLLIRKRDWTRLAGWCVALIGGEILQSVLKLLIRRPRPEFSEALLDHFTYSLPSGHAMTSLIAYSMLSYILISVWEPGRGTRIGIVLSALLLILGIGFSRLYIGVHYLSDVVAGFAAGSFWVCLCITVTTFRQGRRDAYLARNP